MAADPRADSWLPSWMPHPGSIKALSYAYQLVLPVVVLERRAQAVVTAIIHAFGYVPRAIFDATGEELHELVAGLIPGLLMLLEILAVTTLFGAAAGAAVGALLGALAFGAGAVPGAVAGAEVGGEMGFQAGIYVLNWLGLAFLVVYIGKSLLQGVKTAGEAIEIAWRSVDNPRTQEAMTERAARRLAEAVGLVFRGVLQGIIQYLIARGTAAAAARAPELVARLRASKLGAGFADFIDRNWSRLLREPKLRDELPPPKSEGAGATPRKATKVLGEEKAPASSQEQTAAARQANIVKQAKAKGEQLPDSDVLKTDRNDVRISKTYRRPAWRTSTKEQVWENAKQDDGKVYDPKTDQEIKFDDPWQMGHEPGYEFWKMQESVQAQGLSREEFLDMYNDPSHIRPELGPSNMGHEMEAPDDLYLGD